MSLSGRDTKRLKEAGFINYEIGQFGGAVTPSDEWQPPVNLNSPVWVVAMSKRRRWVKEKLDQGLTKKQINKILVNYYFRRGILKRTAFDFIRAEYKPPGKLKDFIKVARRRARDRISRGLGGKSRVYRRG